MRKYSLMVFVLVIPCALIFLSAFSFSQESAKVPTTQFFSAEEVIFDELFYEHGSVMLIMDANSGLIVDANRSALKFYGYTLDEMTKMRIHDINKLNAVEIDGEMKRAVAEERNYFIFKHQLKNGDVRDVEVYSYPYKNSEGQMLLYSIIHDITEKERSKQKLRVAAILLIVGTITFLLFIGIYIITLRKNRNSIRVKSNELENLFNNIEDGFISADVNGIVINVNPVALKILKCSARELVGGSLLKCYKRFDPMSYKEMLFDVTHTYKNRDVLLKDKEGRLIPIEETLVQVYDISKKLTGIVIAFKDMTERIEKQKKIEYLSYHDQLTGLYNRRFLEEMVSTLDYVNSRPIMIMMLDVNGLKLVNDAFGHQYGDELLKAIAQALNEDFGEAMAIARIGGDEFVVLIEEASEAILEEKSEAFKAKISQRNVEGVPLSVSIGVTTLKVEEGFFNCSRIAEDKMYDDKLMESTKFKKSVLATIENNYIRSKHHFEAHSENVVKWARHIGKCLDLSDDYLLKLELAAKFHDVGIMILEKEKNPGNLPPTEDLKKEFMKHPEIGYHILKSVGEYMEVAEWVLVHHERWDGNGYPRGLKGDEINYYGRILSMAEEVAVAFVDGDVKDVQSRQRIFDTIFNSAGTKFDPKMVEVLRTKINQQWLEDY